MSQLSAIDSRIEFEKLLAPHLAMATAYAQAIVGNRHDAEDAVQDAVIKGMTAFDRFQPEQPFKPWWLTILRNSCKDRSRTTRRWLRFLQEWPVKISTRHATSDEQQEQVRRVLGRLSRDHREILELKYLTDCTYAEIAEILSIPQGTVMSRLHAARQQFERLYRGVRE